MDSTKPRKLFVVVPGFGSPNLETKADILRHNMSILPENTDYMVCNYEATPEIIPADLLEHPRIAWKHERGILGEFLHRYATPAYIRSKGYTHVMILLDDVELLHMIHPDMLDSILSRFSLDILSPSLLYPDSTHFPFMVHNPDHRKLALTRQTVVELFCYYMRAETYQRFYSYIDPSNPWMRALDFMLDEYFGFRMGLMNLWVIHHHFCNNHMEEKEHRKSLSEPYMRRYDPTLTWHHLHQIPRALKQITVQDMLYLPHH